MQKSEIFKRYLTVIIGAFFMGLGVALTKLAELGVSTISSVPNVMSIKFTFMTMGNWLTVWNCILILGQVLILKKEFKPIQLLQIAVSVIFGYFTDLGMLIFGGIPTGAYISKLLMSVMGVAVLGFGISLTVIADTVMNPGEAFVKVIADKLHTDFGNTKIAFDFFCVAMAAVMSLCFFDFTLVGIREGTLIAAIGTGTVVKLCCKVLRKPVEKFFVK